MDGWVIFLIIILVVLVIFVIIFLVWFFSHNDKLGQTCTMQSECGTGLVCVNTGTVSVPTYTCKAGFHTPCTGGSTSTQCAPGLTCGSGNICIPLPQTTTTAGSTTSTPSTSNGKTCKSNPPPPPTPAPGSRTRPPWMPPRHPSSPNHPGIHGEQSTRPTTNMANMVPSSVLTTGQPILSSNANDSSEGESSVSETAGESVCLDMCSFSNMTLALYSSGKIVVQLHGAAPRYVNNNVRLKRIFSYNRYLTGLTADGSIVWLEQEQIIKEMWEWKRYANLPNHISSCSVTLDQEYLWMHDSSQNNGYIYRGGSLVEQINHYGYRRVYGNSLDVYAEIDDQKQSAKVYPSGEVFDDVYDIAISHPNNITVLKNSQRDRYRAIAIVNWTAMYINA